ncbi:MAG TPA: hypothetical protein VGP03_07355 [Pseudonocardiaceae bacterium]|nr:hypothetical protein [Pseudonocardiaceae bacterium]
MRTCLSRRYHVMGTSTSQSGRRPRNATSLSVTAASSGTGDGLAERGVRAAHALVVGEPVGDREGRLGEVVVQIHVDTARLVQVPRVHQLVDEVRRDE